MKEVIIIRFDNIDLKNAVKDLKNGDKDAFEKIYKLTYKKVYFFSLSISKNVDLTNDVVQEVYITVFKNIGSLRDEKLFVAWLNKITYNATIKELTKASKRPINIPDEEMELKLVDENNPMIKYVNDESTKELIKNILDLKEKYRTVLILKYFNNYKIKEIAEILDCPEGTVKSRLNTAKEALKEQINKKHSKVVVSLCFGFIVSSALTKTAEASVIGVGFNNTKSTSSINKLKNFTRNNILTIGLVTVIIPVVSIAVISDIRQVNTRKSVHIDYDKSFTNNGIEVLVRVENLNKNDKIQVKNDNNEEIVIRKIDKEYISFIVESNGEYIIDINNEKNKSNITENININNIDKEAPTIKENKTDEEILELVLFDNLSGINYDKLKVYSEVNKDIELISIDKENNLVSLQLVKGVMSLEVFDKVGNSSIYTIKIE